MPRAEYSEFQQKKHPVDYVAQRHIEMKRRSFLRASASMAAAMSMDATWALSRSDEGGLAMPVILLRQTTLYPSRLFAEVWPGDAEVTELGVDLGDVLLGPAARDWGAARVPVVGLTTPSALFCIEQIAGAQGLRTVMRKVDRLQDPTAVFQSVLGLNQTLANEASWRAMPPMTDAHGEGDLAYWLMVPSTFLWRKT